MEGNSRKPGNAIQRKKSGVDVDIYRANGIAESFKKKAGNRAKRTPSYQSIDTEAPETPKEPKISKEIASRMRLFEEKQKAAAGEDRSEDAKGRDEEFEGGNGRNGNGAQESQEKGKKGRPWKKTATKKKSLSGKLRKFSLRPRPASSRKVKDEEDAEGEEELLAALQPHRQMVYHRSDHEGELLPKTVPQRPLPGQQRRSQKPGKDWQSGVRSQSTKEREKARQSKGKSKRLRRNGSGIGGKVFLKQNSSGSEGVRIGETIEEVLPGPPPRPPKGSSMSRTKARARREEPSQLSGKASSRRTSGFESDDEFDDLDEEGSFEVRKEGDEYMETESRAFHTAQPRMNGTSMTREMLEEFTAPRDKRR